MTYEEAFESLVQMRQQIESEFYCEEELGLSLRATNRQIPKKPHFEGDGYWNGELVYDTWVCPNCGTDYEVETDKYNYCPSCGQAIDWGEEE